MSGSSSGDSMVGARGSSSGPKKSKRAGNSNSDKTKQPKRGIGVAQLEKIRIETEMAEYLQGQQRPIHGTGSLSLEDVTMASNSLASSSSSSFHANISASSPYAIHPNLAMAYGVRGLNMRYGEFQSPIIRSPNNHGAIYEAASYSHPSNVALPLLEPEEPIRFKREEDRSQSADSTSTNSNDPQDVDLELKL